MNAAIIIAVLVAASSMAQTVREMRGAAAIVPIQNEPPAKIIVDSPLPETLARGLVVIQYRTENLRPVPVFGPAALAVSPRIGHIHVTIDNAPWVWADASGEPVIVQGLPPGPHKILLQLESANHQTLDEAAVNFTVPKVAIAASAPVQPPQNEPPAKIVIDPPQPEPLSRGVLFISYRTENLRIVPVFGPAALAVAPRIGHIHVTVDDAPWHWADASGNAVIINGLTPGRHKILIELANAVHQVIDQGTVQVTLLAKPNGDTH